nr:RHS repeat-associated core domain-containing protein [Chryseobacterium sp.]
MSNSFSTSNFGSFYSYKYNGKELQETGMFDYGWRQYMPDLGRWNGMDQLSEIYASTSPFAYVANNPISMRDPDGRWMDANGHIDTSGNSNPFRDMAQSQMRMTQFMGRNPGEGGAGGYLNDSYNFTGTQAFSMFNYFKNGGTMSGLSFGDTEVTWYTGTATQDAYRIGDDIFSDIKLGIIHKARIANYGPIDYGKLVEEGLNWIQNNPKTFTTTAGTVEGSSQLVSWGLKKWNAASSISKSRIFAETISTRLPLSAKTLGVTSKGLNVLGKAVGGAGLVNTGYQWSQGKISDTRAIADGIMGVVGFLGPWGAAASLVYFGGIAAYEYYYNDNKPAF